MPDKVPLPPLPSTPQLGFSADPLLRQARSQPALAPGYDVSLQTTQGAVQTLVAMQTDLSRAADALAMFGDPGPNGFQAILKGGLDQINQALKDAQQSTIAAVTGAGAPVATGPGTVSVPVAGTPTGPVAPVNAPAPTPATPLGFGTIRTTGSAFSSGNVQKVEIVDPTGQPITQAPTPAPSSRVRHPVPQGGFTVSPASSGRVRRTEDIAPDEAAGDLPPMWQPGQPVPTVGTLRQRFGQRLTQWANTPRQGSDIEQITEDTALGPMPRWVYRRPDMIDTAMGPMSRTQAEAMGIADPNEPRVPVPKEEVDAYQQSKKRRGMVGNLGQAVAGGGGFGDILSAVAPEAATAIGEFAGPVLAGYGLVRAGLNFETSQRAANAPWQRIYGGSQIEAFGQRARERAFQFGQMGVLSGEDAARLFEGVSSMTTRGGERQEALDFAVSQFKKYGMDISDSLTLINLKLKDSNLSFRDLQNSLDNVTASARAAGINTDQARQQFITQVQGLTPLVGTAAANRLAGSMAQNFAGFGQAASGLGFNLSDTQLRMIAPMTGQSYGQLLGQIQEPGGGNLLNSGVNGLIQRSLGLMGLAPGSSGYNRFVQIAARYGVSPQDIASQRVSSSVIQRIGADLLAQNVINPDTAQAFMAQTGLENVTPGNIGATVAMAAGGGFAAKNPAPVNFSSTANVRAWTRSVLGKSPSDLQPNVALPQPDTWQQAYFSYAQGRGGSSAVIDALVRDQGITGKDLFVVQTSSGPRQVNFTEALQHFPDQLANGTAQLVKGHNEQTKSEIGQSVAEITGMKGENIPSKSASDKSLAGIGRGLKDQDAVNALIKKNEDQAKPKPKTTIMVDAAPPLANLLRIYGPGVSTNFGPNSSNPPIANLATGNRSPGVGG